MIGHTANVFTWAGRANVGRLVLEPGVATIALDLVLWMVVGGGAAALAARTSGAAEPEGYAR